MTAKVERGRTLIAADEVSSFSAGIATVVVVTLSGTLVIGMGLEKSKRERDEDKGISDLTEVAGRPGGRILYLERVSRMLQVQICLMSL